MLDASELNEIVHADGQHRKKPQPESEMTAILTPYKCLNRPRGHDGNKPDLRCYETATANKSQANTKIVCETNAK
jgi:hypothetical protein